MITREDYNKALDVIEAFHKQLFPTVKKSLFNLEVGDFVTCTKVRVQSQNCITLNKSYEVIEVREYGESFIIRDDNDKRKSQKFKSNYFKANT